jgi:hypothetical protein
MIEQDEAKEGLVRDEPAVSQALAGGSLEPMRALLDYWRGRCGARAALPRSELHPEELPALLPHLFLVDRGEREPGDVLFRLVGTAIVRVEGEITGRSLSELIPRADHESVWEHYERALAGELCLRRETLRWQGRAYVHYHVLLLPMTRTGDGIDALLGMALYRFLQDDGALPVGPMA